MNRNLSDIEMDADDLSGELGLSDDEDGERKRVMIITQKQAKRAKRGAPVKKKQVFRQEFDTNVFEVALACLEHKGQIATGDPEFCQRCKAVFNQQSKIVEVDGHQMWECEFCNYRNEVMLDDEEIPKSLEVTYLLEAAAQVQDDKVGGNVSQDISVIFCMDISGSMCVSQPVQGKHKFKGDNLANMNKEMRKFGDGSDQFFSAKDKNVTYVSRLQCVQAAIDQQI